MKEDRRRVVIRGIAPLIDGGRHALKRTPGEMVMVAADAFADGHDHIAVVLQHRPAGTRTWADVGMTALGNDRWAGAFTADAPGDVEYRILGWIDHFATWRDHLLKKASAGVDVPSHLLAGATLLREIAGKRRSRIAHQLRDAADALADATRPEGERVELGRADELADAAANLDPRRHATASATFRVQVDRERARFSSWYELFPRSLGAQGRHGTLKDVIDHLPYVAGMGFDVLYLPPVHPIGTTHRKGRNNATVAEPDDVGSPWAIGGPDGGHTAVHPALGTVEDVAHLAAVAREEHGIDLALDLAFQCSPDHPWVSEHPEWFRHRPDGSIQYAENPPKRYEDIYPLDFESEDAAGLWQALKDVILFWVGHGVRVFRVDNPHTKSLRFWEWAIAEVRREHPDVIFLAEAFTRPRLMEELAKRGFAQSYSYFTWREHKWEIETYVRELFHSERIDYMRPCFWPNTPDILPEHLQHGGRSVFINRLVLAALLNASYGIYGPPFELLEHEARHLGSEEYLDSEKYQLRSWNLDDPASLAPLIATINRARREHACLQANHNLTQHHADNDALLAWSKCTDDGSDAILVVVSLDPRQRQAGTLRLDLGGLRLGDDEPFTAHDLLTGASYDWQGPASYVELGPELPAHVLHIQRRGDG